MASYIRYTDKDSPDYKRTLATSAVIYFQPADNISIDFCEEYFVPFVVTKRNMYDDVVEYSHDQEELQVTRERKVSVVMNKKQAVEMAIWIMENLYEEVK